MTGMDRRVSKLAIIIVFFVDGVGGHVSLQKETGREEGPLARLRRTKIRCTISLPDDFLKCFPLHFKNADLRHFEDFSWVFLAN